MPRQKEPRFVEYKHLLDKNKNEAPTDPPERPRSRKATGRGQAHSQKTQEDIRYPEKEHISQIEQYGYRSNDKAAEFKRSANRKYIEKGYDSDKLDVHPLDRRSVKRDYQQHKAKQHDIDGDFNYRPSAAISSKKEDITGGNNQYQTQRYNHDNGSIHCGKDNYQPVSLKRRRENKHRGDCHENTSSREKNMSEKRFSQTAPSPGGCDMLASTNASRSSTPKEIPLSPIEGGKTSTSRTDCQTYSPSTRSPVSFAQLSEQASDDSDSDMESGSSSSSSVDTDNSSSSCSSCSTCGSSCSCCSSGSDGSDDGCDSDGKPAICVSERDHNVVKGKKADKRHDTSHKRSSEKSDTLQHVKGSQVLSKESRDHKRTQSYSSPELYRSEHQGRDRHFKNSPPSWYMDSDYDSDDFDYYDDITDYDILMENIRTPDPRELESETSSGGEGDIYENQDSLGSLHTIPEKNSEIPHPNSQQFQDEKSDEPKVQIFNKKDQNCELILDQTLCHHQSPNQNEDSITNQLQGPGDSVTDPTQDLNLDQREEVSVVTSDDPNGNQFLDLSHEELQDLKLKILDDLNPRPIYDTSAEQLYVFEQDPLRLDQDQFPKLEANCSLDENKSTFEVLACSVQDDIDKTENQITKYFSFSGETSPIDVSGTNLTNDSNLLATESSPTEETAAEQAETVLQNPRSSAEMLLQDLPAELSLPVIEKRVPIRIKMDSKKLNREKMMIPHPTTLNSIDMDGEVLPTPSSGLSTLMSSYREAAQETSSKTDSLPQDDEKSPAVLESVSFQTQPAVMDPCSKLPKLNPKLMPSRQHSRSSGYKRDSRFNNRRGRDRSRSPVYSGRSYICRSRSRSWTRSRRSSSRSRRSKSRSRRSNSRSRRSTSRSRRSRKFRSRRSSSRSRFRRSNSRSRRSNSRSGRGICRSRSRHRSRSRGRSSNRKSRRSRSSSRSKDHKDNSRSSSRERSRQRRSRSTQTPSRSKRSRRSKSNGRAKNTPEKVESRNMKATNNDLDDSHVHPLPTDPVPLFPILNFGLTPKKVEMSRSTDSETVLTENLTSASSEHVQSTAYDQNTEAGTSNPIMESAAAPLCNMKSNCNPNIESVVKNTNIESPKCTKDTESDIYSQIMKSSDTNLNTDSSECSQKNELSKSSLKMDPKIESPKSDPDEFSVLNLILESSESKPNMENELHLERETPVDDEYEEYKRSFLSGQLRSFEECLLPATFLDENPLPSSLPAENKELELLSSTLVDGKQDNSHSTVNLLLDGNVTSDLSVKAETSPIIQNMLSPLTNEPSTEGVGFVPNQDYSKKLTKDVVDAVVEVDSSSFSSPHPQLTVKPCVTCKLRSVDPLETDRCSLHESLIDTNPISVSSTSLSIIDQSQSKSFQNSNEKMNTNESDMMSNSAVLDMKPEHCTKNVKYVDQNFNVCCDSPNKREGPEDQPLAAGIKSPCGIKVKDVEKSTDKPHKDKETGNFSCDAARQLGLESECLPSEKSPGKTSLKKSSYSGRKRRSSSRSSSADREEHRRRRHGYRSTSRDRDRHRRGRDHHRQARDREQRHQQHGHNQHGQKYENNHIYVHPAYYYQSNYNGDQGYPWNWNSAQAASSQPQNIQTICTDRQLRNKHREIPAEHIDPSVLNQMIPDEGEHLTEQELGRRLIQQHSIDSLSMFPKEDQPVPPGMENESVPYSGTMPTHQDISSKGYPSMSQDTRSGRYWDRTRQHPSQHTEDRHRSRRGRSRSVDKENRTRHETSRNRRRRSRSRERSRSKSRSKSSRKHKTSGHRGDLRTERDREQHKHRGGDDQGSSRDRPERGRDHDKSKGDDRKKEREKNRGEDDSTDRNGLHPKYIPQQKYKDNNKDTAVEDTNSISNLSPVDSNRPKSASSDHSDSDGSVPAGYCFVEFPDPEEGQRAMLRLSGKMIPGSKPPKLFKLNSACFGREHLRGQEYSLFIGDLSEEVDDLMLYSTFHNKYKSLKAAKVVIDHAGKSRGYGFIRFGDEDEHKRALVEMQRYIGLGRNAIKVSPATPKRRGTYNSYSGGQSQNQSQMSNQTSYNTQNYSQQQYYQQWWQGYQDPSQYYQYPGYMDYSQSQQAAPQTQEEEPEEDLEDPELEVDVDKENEQFMETSEELYLALEGSRWHPIDNVTAPATSSASK